MTSRALRVYTALVALVCGVAIAVAIQSHQAAAKADQWRRAWRGEARSWRALARRAVAANTATQRHYHTVALRYNHLVGATKRSQATLVHALQQAQQAPPAPLYVPSPVTYRTVAAPASAGVPASVPAPAPTTRSS